jgi:hypothetical protein
MFAPAAPLRLLTLTTISHDDVVPGEDFHLTLALHAKDAAGAPRDSNLSSSASSSSATTTPPPPPPPPVAVREIRVAWHGVERLDPARVKRRDGHRRDGTGLGPGERFIARSPVGVVARDVIVPMDQTRAFRVGARLPPGIPPSYDRGGITRIKYYMSFTAIVTTERGGGPSRDGVVEHVVELPVLAADGFGESGGGVVVGEGASPPPSPSEREGGSLGLTLLDLDAARESGSVDAPRTPRVVPPASPTLAEAASLRSPPRSPLAYYARSGANGDASFDASAANHDRIPSFNITVGDERLLRVIARPPLPRVRPGDCVSGVFDLRVENEDGGEDGRRDLGGRRAPRCIRATATLESEEAVSTTAGHVAFEDAEAMGEVISIVTPWGHSDEDVRDLRESCFVLTVPKDAPVRCVLLSHAGPRTTASAR